MTWTSRMRSRRPNRWTAGVEILAMAALLLSYIWVWRRALPGAFFICLALYLAIGVTGHLWRGESPRDLGFRLDNLRVAARNATPVLLAFVIPSLIAGATLGSVYFPNPILAVLKLLRGWIWGTLQQYGLLCVFYRRIREISASDTWATALAGVVFAVFHWPNPFLVVVTLVAGTVSCWLYRREPNVPVLGAVHSAVSFVNYHALPSWVTLSHHVGP